MKSVALPSRQDLHSALEALSWKAPADVTAERLVRWAHWARLDARLAELLVRFLTESFREINPFSLWEKNRISPEPQALAALIEFAVHRARRTRAPDAAKDLRAWGRLVTKNTPAVSPRMFFIREGSPNPERDRRQIEASLRPYLRWGYFGDESLAGDAGSPLKKSDTTMMGKAERGKILNRLLATEDSIRVEDYIRACQGRVHRRTAQRDLSECKKARGRGFTRGKRFKLKRRPVSNKR